LKLRKKHLILLLTAVIALAVAAAWAVRYRDTHIFIEGKAYPNDAAILDLRGTGLTAREYDAVSQALPGTRILWNIPFQGSLYAGETEEIAFSRLTQEDVATLRHFPQLTLIDASGCTDYPLLMQVKEDHPGAKLLYQVEIDGQSWHQDTRELTFSSLSQEELELITYLPQLETVKAPTCRDLALLKKLQERYPQLDLAYYVAIDGLSYDRFSTELTLTGTDLSDLAQKLSHMPDMTAVTITEPTGGAEALLTMLETYPDIRFTWSKDVLGVTVHSDDVEVDLSGTKPESLEQIAEEMAYFPTVEKLILCQLEFDDETMAAFREKMRPEYKVVWDLTVGYMTIRSDDTWFMPGKFGQGLIDEQAYVLRYCEDMVCVDVGHKSLTNCDWAAFMPNLKYLIIADTCIEDLTPLEGLDQLVYLEIFMSHVRDYSPLLKLRSLEDLNLSRTYGDPTIIAQMTWLKRVCWNCGPNARLMLKDHLTETTLILYGSHSTEGWRQCQNYYDMRDYLGMPYMY